MLTTRNVLSATPNSFGLFLKGLPFSRSVAEVLKRFVDSLVVSDFLKVHRSDMLALLKQEIPGMRAKGCSFRGFRTTTKKTKQSVDARPILHRLGSQICCAYPVE